jgi:hypothetical protein
MMPGTCDVIPPPIVETSPGHRILCHLSVDTLMAMEPVIQVDGGAAAIASRTSPARSAPPQRPNPPRGGFGGDPLITFQAPMSSSNAFDRFPFRRRDQTSRRPSEWMPLVNPGRRRHNG